MEKRLELIIDPSEARKGAAEAKRITGDVAKSALKAVEAYQKLSDKMESAMKVLNAFEKSISGNVFGKFISNIQSSNKALAEVSKQSNTMAKDLTKAIGDINKSSSKAETGLKKLRESTDKTSGKFADLRSSISQTRTTMNNLNKAVSKAASGIAKSMDTAKDRIDNFNTKVTSANKTVSTLSKRMGSLDGHVKSARDNFKNLNTPLAKSSSLMDKMNLAAIDGAYAISELSSVSKNAGTNVDNLSGKMDKASGSTGRFREQMVASQKAFTQLKNETLGLSDQMDRTDGKMKKLGNSFTDLSASMKSAAKGLDDAVNRLQRMQKELDRTREDVDRTKRSVNGLGAAFGTLAATIGGISFSNMLVETGKFIDSYTEVENRLAVVTDGTRDLSEATKDLLDISVESRTSLDSTMDVYSKITRVADRFKLTQAEIARVTESVSKAVSMSGASVAGAQGAMMQFSQALSGDFKASAQELNSIIEQTPALAATIAQALNTVEGFSDVTTASLKKLAGEGMISSEQVIEGILNISGVIDNQFANSTKTMAQGWQAFVDTLRLSAGQFDDAVKVTETFNNEITDIRENINGFTSSLAGATAGVAVFIGGAALAGLVAIMTPLAAGIAGVLAAIGALTSVFVSARTETALLTAEAEKAVNVNKQLKESLIEVSKGYDSMSTAKISNQMAEYQMRIAEVNEELAKVQRERDILGVENIYDRSGVEQLDNRIKSLVERQKMYNDELAKMRTVVQSGSWEDLVSFTKGLFTETEKASDAADRQTKAIAGVVVELLREEEALRLTGKQIAQQEMLMQAYKVAKEQGVKVTTEFVQKVIEQANAFYATSEATKNLNSSTKSYAEQLEDLKRSIDPVYDAQRTLEEQMKVLKNSGLKPTSEEFTRLSDIIHKEYNEAIRSAAESTRELLNPIENVRNTLNGVQGAYDSYNQKATMIVNSTGSQAEKIRLLEQAYKELGWTIEDQQKNKMDFTSDVPTVSGFEENPFDKYAREEQALQDWYNRKLEMHEGNLIAQEQLELVYAERTKALETSRRETIEGSLFSLTDSMRVIAGEQSGIYKAMFAVQKAYAISTAMAALPTALAQAWNLPWPANLAAAATAAASVASIIANAQSLAMVGQAHDGIDEVPQTGTWLLEKGERVTTKGTSAKLDKTLDEIREGEVSGGSGRGMVVNQTINVSGNVDNRTASQMAADASRRQKQAQRRFGRGY